ncbi:MAG: hypothetical protein RLZ51_120 [Pseudomonadota bacterium]
MDPQAPALVESLKWLGTALGLGLLIGLERERKGDSRGLRTFGLVGLLGGLTGQLALRSGRWELLATGLALIGLIAISAYWRPSPGNDTEAPTTSVVAMTVTGALGLLSGLGELVIAVALGIVVVSLLYFKAELKGVAGRLGRDDLVAILQFGALSFIVLPLLPDRAWGPRGSLNPRDIWLTVVLIAGVSLIGYLALRFAGQRYGPALAAMAGGLVSSTASTLVFSRQARQAAQLQQASRMILLANLAMGLRMTALILIFAPGLFMTLGLAVIAGVLVLILGALIVGRDHGLHALDPPAAALPSTEAVSATDAGNTGKAGTQGDLNQVVNPVKLSVALAFGLAYGGITLVAALSTDRLGPNALYGVALLSGLTDIDALTLSTFRLLEHQGIDQASAAIAISLAVLANFAMKGLIVISAGGRSAARRCLPPLMAASAAIAGALALTLRHSG